MWRDGNFLVVDVNSANFAGRCPWTNLPENSTTLVPIFGPRPAGWQVSVQKGLHYGSKGKLLSLQLPASSGWLQRRRAAKQKFGFVIAGLGIAALLAGIVLAILLYQLNPEVFRDPHPNPFTVSVILMVLGVAGSIAGLAWPNIEGAPGPGGYIRAELIDEPHIWLHGANSQFLQQLPAWNGQPLQQRKISGPSALDAMAGGWPIVVVLFLIGMVVATLICSAK